MRTILRDCSARKMFNVCALKGGEGSTGASKVKNLHHDEQAERDRPGLKPKLQPLTQRFCSPIETISTHSMIQPTPTYLMPNDIHGTV